MDDSPEDKDAYRRVRRENPVPVAGGETEFTRYGFRDMFAGGCVDVAQPDLGVCGGFTAFVQILALATAFSVPVIPHVWGSGVAVAAALQAIAAIPPLPHTANPIPLQNEPVIEFDRKHNPLNSEQFWRQKVGDVRVDEVFFHAYFEKAGKAC